MGGLQAEMFLRVVLMLGFVSFWQICPSGESIANTGVEPGHAKMFRALKATLAHFTVTL